MIKPQEEHVVAQTAFFLGNIGRQRGAAAARQSKASVFLVVNAKCPGVNKGALAQGIVIAHTPAHAVVGVFHRSVVEVAARNNELARAHRH